MIHVKRLLARNTRGVIISVLVHGNRAFVELAVNLPMLGLSRDDAARALTVGHERHEILPQCLDQRRREFVAGHVRVEPRAKKQFRAVDVADARAYALVHEELTDALA